MDCPGFRTLLSIQHLQFFPLTSEFEKYIGALKSWKYVKDSANMQETLPALLVQVTEATTLGCLFLPLVFVSPQNKPLSCLGAAWVKIPMHPDASDNVELAWRPSMDRRGGLLPCNQQRLWCWLPKLNFSFKGWEISLPNCAFWPLLQWSMKAVFLGGENSWQFLWPFPPSLLIAQVGCLLLAVNWLCFLL